ncbi:glycosyl transferase family 1 [Paenibacillus sp. FSL H7-0326]|uniref:glycosyltransferase family 4 protein n=1 Tax=Paenibacillus sp. FSL H7-0326 TaxID=1921144 RepID=UPI00096EE9E6|nr:glycosyltransferase family 4 protein [Paenibacillus sp. FSL H7-0326]OMC66332.1 glycosyl transferase family 1 [Paenibacillus sp. FSL H7-0326]
MGYISVLTHSFADGYNRDFERLFGGGLERYIFRLCQVIRDIGHIPEVHQLSYYEAFHRTIEEIEVFGYPYDPDHIPQAFDEMASRARGPLIYASCIWHPLNYAPGSLGICHGINWDRHNLPAAAKREIAGSIQRALDQLDTLVSVDSHFLTYCRAACTYQDPHQVVLIPNSVDTEYFKPVHLMLGDTDADKTIDEQALRKKVKGRTAYLHHGDEEQDGEQQDQEHEGEFNSPADLNAAIEAPDLQDADDSSNQKSIRLLFPRRISLERGIIPMMLASDRLLGAYPTLTIEFAGERVEGSTIGKTFEIWRKHHPHKDRIYAKSYKFDEMLLAYQQADIAVIPTIFSEGTSYACLEAMSCGLPVVAGNVGGLNDIVQDGFNGLSVPPVEENIVAAICRLIDDDELRERMGNQARQTALAYDDHKWELAWKTVLQHHLSRKARKERILLR